MTDLNPALVNEAFLAATPYIAEQILDLTVKHPNWLASVWEEAEWPHGVGTQMQQLIFKGAMPQIERGFDRWGQPQNLQGCDPCGAPNCSYNWTDFGGHGFERKIISLLERDFKSPSYCVKEIQTTSSYQEVFAQIVRNLYRQADYFKEMNIGLNFLTMVAKKYVVDSGGAKGNTQNPYVYRNTLGAQLSALNLEMLEFFYEHLRRIPDTIPYDVIDGSPLFALEASHQLLSRLYRDDTNLRQDVRFSGLANDLVARYNFMSTIRGMFIAAPILYPRRFNIVSGEPVEVLPFVNGIPAEVGAYTGLNPAYEAATHEEVLIHGRHPFKIYHMSTVDSLGANTSFGPEPTFMTNWVWVNPLTTNDPFRREGYFATSAKIGLSQQFSDGVFAILVARPSTALMAAWNPVPTCPPEEPSCDNEVPDVACPCPIVLSMTPDPFTAGQYVLVFATNPSVAAQDPIQLQLDNGAYIEGTVEQVSTDGKTVAVSFATDPGADITCHVVNVFCDDNLGCSAKVVKATDCRSDQTDTVKLTLSNAIKALTAGQDVLAYFADCTEALLNIVSVDVSTLTWEVEYGTGYGPTDDPTGGGATVLNAGMLCDRGGIIKICVPPTTDASCPACAVSVTECVNEE